jgi:multiple sugar transport system permease protein
VPRRRWRRYPPYLFYLFIASWLLVGFLFLTSAAVVVNTVESFTTWDGFVGDHLHWWILDNYQALVHDSGLRDSIKQTFEYTAITVTASVIGSLGLAVFLNQPHRGVRFFRSVFYLPTAISIVVAGMAFATLFNYPSGLINDVVLHLGGNVTDMLDTDTAFVAVILMSVWQLGMGMVIFMAGLQGISPELLEAACVDGSSKVQTFFRITAPLLSPVILFQVITGVISCFQAFVAPMALRGGNGVQSSTLFYMLYVFGSLAPGGDCGYGAAVLEIGFVFLLVLAFVIFRLSARFVYYESSVEGR